MTLREEFERTKNKGETYNDGDYVIWLLNEMADAEFAMGDIHGDLVLTERYDDMLSRSDKITKEIMSFFPEPVSGR